MKPEVSNVLQKREDYAVSLRKAARKQIVESKRRRIQVKEESVTPTGDTPESLYKDCDFFVDLAPEG